MCTRRTGGPEDGSAAAMGELTGQLLEDMENRVKIRAVLPTAAHASAPRLCRTRYHVHKTHAHTTCMHAQRA